jgi:hypothetical protein
MKRKLLTLMLTMCLVLAGCGGVPHDEYDKVVTERDELKKENDNMQKVLELNTKVAECKAKIEAEYEHAKFTILVTEKASGQSTEEAMQSVDDLYNTSINTLNATIDTWDTIDSLTEIDDETYNSAIQTVDTVDETWEKTYESVISIEEMMVGN